MKREVTHVLHDLAAGNERASAELLTLVYEELRGLARAQMARLRPGQTLQPTALVHDAWFKLMGGEPNFEGRRHFFGAAARAMRELVIDHLRARSAHKRGGGRDREELDSAFAVAASGMPTDDVLAIDAALTSLEREHPRKAKVVEMRYFGGYSVEEIAEALDVTPRTVEREWRFARAYLHDVLAPAGA